MELKEARVTMKTKKAIFKRAKRSHLQAQKHGSDKQKTACEKRMNSAKLAYLRSLLEYKKLKKEAGLLKSLFVNKATAITTLAITTVATVLVAGAILNGRNSSGAGETAGDSV